MKKGFFKWILIIILINVSSCFLLMNSNFVFAASEVKLDFFTWGGSSADMGTGIAMDSAENAFVSGRTSSFGVGGYDLCLVKFNTTNGVEWNSTWGGIDRDEGWDVVLDSSGNAYVTGDTCSFGRGDSDLCLVKFNSIGGIEWNSTWGGIYEEVGNAITLDSLGNTFVAGWTSSFGAGGDDMCLVKFNSTGGVEWNSTWGGLYDDSGADIALDSSGNAYVTGFTHSFGKGEKDVCLVKFNSTGVVQWNCTWGDISDDEASSITLDSLGNIYISGYTRLIKNGVNFGQYALLGKFNSTGNLKWIQKWREQSINYGEDIIMDSSGNFFIVVNSAEFNDYDIYLFQFNSTGDVIWHCRWGDIGFEFGYGLIKDSLGNIFISGVRYAPSSDGNSDVLLVKFTPGQCPVSEQQISGYELVLVLSITFIVSTFLIRKLKLNGISTKSSIRHRT